MSVTYRQIFRIVEFRALFTAQAVSVVGDQFARVALSVLVFDRTRSAALTALTYGLTFLPDVVAGPLLTGLADRYPRRRVMVTADVARALLVTAMAMRGLPLWLVCVLLVAVQLIGPPADAARLATLPAVLDGEAFARGQGTMQAFAQAAQVVGFAAGGALVAGIGPSGVLLADAGTFAMSALLVRIWVTDRPPAAGRRARWWRHMTSGIALVWLDPKLRALVAFACISGFYIAGEALAVPYATDLGGGATTVGLLFAAYAAGCAVASLLVARLPESVRLRAMPPLVVAACAPLVLCAVNPPLPVVLALFTLSGAASAYHVVVATTFTQLVPDEHRAQAVGLARTTFRVAQGVGVAVAGVCAEWFTPHDVIAVAGALGVLAALGVGLSWRSAGAPAGAAPAPDHPAGPRPTRAVGVPAEGPQPDS